MVQLTEVPDEHFETPQAGPDVDDDYTDTESEISTESDDDIANETLADRISALRDIIPPSTRSWIANSASNVASATRSGAWLSGRILWAVSATALMIGVPFAILATEEQQMAAMEQEYKMREMGGEVLTGGEQSTADRLSSALGAETKSAL